MIIHQHTIDKVHPLGGKGISGFCPGELVVHCEDEKSLGTVVASDAGGVTVLWSRPPVGTIDMMEVRVQEISASSRKLKTGWRVVSEDDDILKSASVRTLLGLKT